jgi:hypothetical protein
MNIGAMPTRIPSHKLAQLDESSDTLRLCAPLSPSQNVLNQWIATKNYRLLSKFKRVTLDHLKLQTILALGTGYPRPWANFTELTIIRCAPRRIDEGNIIGGCKTTIDSLQSKFGGGKHWVEGCGLIIDDSDKHLKIVSATNCLRRDWGDLDVGTWLFLKRIR